MKLSTLALAFWAAVGLAPLAAQTVPPEDRTLENAFLASDIQFLYDPGATLQPQQAGVNLLTVDGFGPGYVYDFCADFFTGENELSTYGVSSGLGSLPNQELIQVLFSNTLPAFRGMIASYIALNGGDWSYNPTLNAEYDQLQGYGAGMQIALWELIHEQSGDYSILDGGSIPGTFRIDTANAPNDRADIADDLAENFLTNIRSGNWVNQGGLNYFFADGGTDQDRLWVVVPEPSSAVLGAFGMLVLLRRRRA